MKCAPTWRLHTGLCKFVQNISTNIWRLEKRTDLKLREMSSLFIFYNTIISWLYTLNGFRFIFFYCVTVQAKNNRKRTHTCLWLLYQFLILLAQVFFEESKALESYLMDKVGIHHKFEKQVPRLFTLYWKLLCDCFNMFLKEIISNDTRCQIQIWKLIWNTWKYRWNETDDEILPVFDNFSDFEINFLEFPQEIVFGVISGNGLYF